MAKLTYHGLTKRCTSIIAGDDIDAVLVDVTPLSLGIDTVTIGVTGHLQEDRFVPLIRRNTTVPMHKSKVFSTVFPGQSAIHVKVYAAQLRQIVANIRQAAANDAGDEVQAWCDRLIDRLFEVEEDL